jgi:hypothetical protein
MGLQTVEAIGPLGMGAAKPVVHGQQALELKSRRAALAVTGSADEACALQNLEVLSDSRLRQCGGCGEFDDASLAGPETLKNRAAGGIGKGGEGEAQGIASRHYRKVI